MPPSRIFLGKCDIIIKRNITPDVVQKVNRVLRKSIEYAFQNPNSPLSYMTMHAQEMEKEVMQKHVDLYVNKYSIDLGEKGKSSIIKMFDLAQEKKIIPSIKNQLFID